MFSFCFDVLCKLSMNVLKLQNLIFLLIQSPQRMKVAAPGCSSQTLDMRLDHPPCLSLLEEKLSNVNLVSTTAVLFSINFNSLGNNIIPCLSIYQEVNVLKALG